MSCFALQAPKPRLTWIISEHQHTRKHPLFVWRRPRLWTSCSFCGGILWSC